MSTPPDASPIDGAAEVVAGPIERDFTPGLLGGLLRRLPRHAALGEIGWVTGSYGFGQIARFASNVILARLLAPQIFGVMLIVNTLRTGLELLSDIGIAHNIISNVRGSEPAFFNTAYTLQVIRGFALGGLTLLFGSALVHTYAEPDLVVLAPLMSVLFVLSGLQAPSRYLMMKHGEVRRYALSDIALTIGSLVINVALALYSPTIWALFIGLILTTLVQTLVTHLLMPRGVLKLRLERRSVSAILSFGKWVFASSLIYFLAMNYDRLYFAKVIPFALLGVYGVSRTIADTAGQLVQRVGSMLVYPKIAASRQEGAVLRATLSPIRGKGLFVITVALAVAVASSDGLVLLLYDRRYLAAAFMLPILLAGVWFSILATLGESIMMGTGRPAHAARANLVKFIFICGGLPLAIRYDGMAMAVTVIAVGDAVRYVSFALSQRRYSLSFARQDAALTAGLIAMTVLWRIALMSVGIVPDVATWWSYGNTLHG